MMIDLLMFHEFLRIMNSAYSLHTFSLYISVNNKSSNSSNSILRIPYLIKIANVSEVYVNIHNIHVPSRSCIKFTSIFFCSNRNNIVTEYALIFILFLTLYSMHLSSMGTFHFYAIIYDTSELN